MDNNDETLPKVRLGLGIFEDIKKLCDRGTSRKFRLTNPDGTPYVAQRPLQPRDVNTSIRHVPVKKCNSQPALGPQKKKAATERRSSGDTRQPVLDEVSRSRRKSSNLDTRQSIVPSPLLMSDGGDAPASKIVSSSSSIEPVLEEQRSSQEPASVEQRSFQKKKKKNRKNRKRLTTALEENSSEVLGSTLSSSIVSSIISHPGFPNKKYMCYMNAVVQALLASTPFCDYLLGLKLDRYNKDHRVLRVFVWLAKRINRIEEEQDKDPSLYGMTVKYGMEWLHVNFAQEMLEYDPKVQHDVTDFFMKALENLEAVTKLLGPEKDISKCLFELTSKSVPTNCPSCGKNVAPEKVEEHSVFFLGMMGVEPDTSIQKLIEENLVTEYEERCCGNDIKCSSRIQTLPDILMVGLKRYTKNNKIRTALEISTELVLAGFFDERSDSEESENSTMDFYTNKCYNLVGVVKHIGRSLSGGHYISYVYDQAEESWMQCNDTIVDKVDICTVVSDSSQDCYLLVYSAGEEMPDANDTLKQACDEKSQCGADQEMDSLFGEESDKEIISSTGEETDQELNPLTGKETNQELDQSTDKETDQEMNPLSSEETDQESSGKKLVEESDPSSGEETDQKKKSSTGEEAEQELNPSTGEETDQELDSSTGAERVQEMNPSKGEEIEKASEDNAEEMEISQSEDIGDSD